MPANPAAHTEAAFETVIEEHLLANGYVSIDRSGFDRERAIFPETVLAFIRETQPAEWARLEALLGPGTGDQIVSDLCKWMDLNGSLATLRHGFKCYGRTLRVAFFKAAHRLNPELEARYAANRLGITRQLRFSPRSERSLDVAISLNGIPVATAELKNPLTGQTVEDALGQYRQDRDPRETIFDFKRRTLVHFAVDTEAVFMATRLAGAAVSSSPSTGAVRVAPVIRPTRPGAAIAPPISGRRCSSGTASWTCWRASSTSRSRRGGTTRAARRGRRG